MSWQTYVDSNLLGHKSETGQSKISQAAILGQKGGIWAISSGFKLSPEEQAALLSAYTNADATRANGIRVGGVKYFTLSVGERTIQGKKGGDGVVIVKTKQAILVAVYNAPTQAPEVSKIVEDLADYLISTQY